MKGNRMKRVVVESPYQGNIAVNEIYGELCMYDCLVNYNESPYASHLLYTRKYVLRDHIEAERKLGIEAGFCWRDVAEQSNFYIDLGISIGMKLGIADCESNRKSYETRKLSNDLWNKFILICESNKYEIPVRLRN